MTGQSERKETESLNSWQSGWNVNILHNMYETKHAQGRACIVYTHTHMQEHVSTMAHTNTYGDDQRILLLLRPEHLDKRTDVESVVVKGMCKLLYILYNQTSKNKKKRRKDVTTVL